MMDRKEFAKAVFERWGNMCWWPRCTAKAVDAAHILPAQMGGRKEHDPENGWPLCRRHHDVYDSRTNAGSGNPVAGASWEWRQLAKAYCDQVQALYLPRRFPLDRIRGEEGYAV